MRNMHTVFEASLRAENAMRNRYPNILSNESTRIRLREVASDESDYVNANAITGFDRDSSAGGYIATQAPVPATMAHFWQMIYEEKCPLIVMLTREEEVHSPYPKCNRYWPSAGKCTMFGRYFVLGHEERANKELGIIERKFRVGKNAENANPGSPGMANQGIGPAHEVDFQTPIRRPARSVDARPIEMNSDAEPEVEQEGEALEVTLVQYVDWPDQGVPRTAETLLSLCGMVDEMCGKEGAGRPVVHCSAGVGRTGTFISVHKLLTGVYNAFPMTGQGGTFSIPHVEEIVGGLKKERSKMVQTAEQYRFIFIALAQGIQQYRHRVAAKS